MKINKPTNPNYCATVVTIKNKLDLAGCDNVVGTTIFGYQAIISKQTEVGTPGIIFPAETQLSDTYCTENNMYRHAENNRDKIVKGYIEDSRRVRAIKFRGHVSNALFMPLSSLSYLGIKENGLGYLKHFLGPLWWLAPLMLVIELISHIVRPISLGLRLANVLKGDHTVVGIFTDLVPVILPIPFYLMGMFVCFVQAFVFTLLSMVYISLATAHDH